MILTKDRRGNQEKVGRHKSANQVNCTYHRNENLICHNNIETLAIPKKLKVISSCLLLGERDLRSPRLPVLTIRHQFVAHNGRGMVHKLNIHIIQMELSRSSKIFRCIIPAKACVHSAVF